MPAGSGSRCAARLSPGDARSHASRTTWLLIGALFLVAGALWPWSALARMVCAAGAIGSVLIVFAGRLRAHAGAMPGPDADITQTRIDRIRAERSARMGRRR